MVLQPVLHYLCLDHVAVAHVVEMSAALLMVH